MVQDFRGLRKFLDDGATSKQRLTQQILTTKLTKDTKVSEYFSYKHFLNFVIFVTFVVKNCLSLFGCGSAALGQVRLPAGLDCGSGEGERTQIA
jgi:hypothetical protein